MERGSTRVKRRCVLFVVVVRWLLRLSPGSGAVCGSTFRVSSDVTSEFLVLLFLPHRCLFVYHNYRILLPTHVFLFSLLAVVFVRCLVGSHGSLFSGAMVSAMIFVRFISWLLKVVLSLRCRPWNKRKVELRSGPVLEMLYPSWSSMYLLYFESVASRCRFR